ncbi:MAG TPA: hypothetical protein VHG33_00335, partial [Woeseiaceae bacterium]|nr:hypothetical protein [Woeseiaceae bacterium]
MDLLDWLQYEVFDNTLLAWSTALVTFVVAWFLLGVARRMIGKHLQVLAERRELTPLKIAAHTAGRTKGWFLFVMAVFIGSRFLDLPPAADSALTKAATIGLLLQMGLWATAAFTVGMRLRREKQLTIDPEAVAAMDVLGFVLRAAVWSFVLLLALDNLGIDITALVAGLGIGG